MDVAEGLRADCARLELETFSDLGAAAHRYRSAGFARVSAAASDRWGRRS